LHGLSGISSIYHFLLKLKPFDYALLEEPGGLCEREHIAIFERQACLSVAGFHSLEEVIPARQACK